ncbi:hypothetical protein [Nannocystis pusilla]|uniref:Uncharacterized protein n=1 Tax=Nannocystis pusilla TaxID=889268 RepID=A0ABS7U3W9_9BACT|nr:hypothetical protein [Nannocystis pusilla]MBZ5715260.1 hypothetical protein [Nannocystis pusilla]
MKKSLKRAEANLERIQNIRAALASKMDPALVEEMVALYEEGIEVLHKSYEELNRALEAKARKKVPSKKVPSKKTTK